MFISAKDLIPNSELDLFLLKLLASTHTQLGCPFITFEASIDWFKIYVTPKKASFFNLGIYIQKTTMEHFTTAILEKLIIALSTHVILTIFKIFYKWILKKWKELKIKLGRK